MTILDCPPQCTGLNYFSFDVYSNDDPTSEAAAETLLHPDHAPRSCTVSLVTCTHTLTKCSRQVNKVAVGVNHIAMQLRADQGLFVVPGLFWALDAPNCTDYLPQKIDPFTRTVLPTGTLI